jgi:SAM-dependent methyltransferase
MADLYAQGMVHYTDEQRDLTPELDRFQFGLFRRYLGPKILEVGGGSGRLTELVVQQGGYEEFITIEPSAHFSEILRHRYLQNSSVMVLSCTTAEIQDSYREHFDTVFSVHVMEHIADDRGFLQECLALTRPGGAVIVLVPALQFLYSDLDRNIGHFRRYDKAMVRRLITGLEVQIETLQFNNFLGVLASAYFIKLRKLDYQKDEMSRSRFFRLASLYSKYVMPVVRAAERLAPPPVGLNLTMVLRKPAR